MRAYRKQLLCGVLLLLPAATGCQQTRHLVDYLRGNTPVKSALRMEDIDSPDDRRQGINDLAKRDFARREPYTTRYRQLAHSDENPQVRAAAIRALNLSRDAGATPIFVKALGDENALVRLEAVKALGNLPDPASVETLVRLVRSDENKDVRIAAADALKHYKTLEVARVLIPLLGEQDFGVAWHARRSLRKLTGHDFAYDEAAWLALISGPENPLG